MDRLVQGGVLVPRDSLHLEVVMDNGNYSVKLTEYLASYHGYSILYGGVAELLVAPCYQNLSKLWRFIPLNFYVAPLR